MRAIPSNNAVYTEKGFTTNNKVLSKVRSSEKSDRYSGMLRRGASRDEQILVLWQLKREPVL